MAIVNSRAAIEPKTGKAAIFVNETIHSLMRKLFSNGEQGFFYDPNDLSTMYQNAAGTIPVTTAGQPVGLMLDKSKGLVLGGELAINGSFDTDTAWNKNTGVTISGGSVNINTTSSGLAVAQYPNVPAGKLYKVTYTVSSYTSGSIRCFVGGVTGVVRNTVGTHTEYVISTGPSTIQLVSVGGFVGSADNFSVKEVLGNHAYQPTSASRPILRKNAETGANYLEFDGSDDFLQADSIDFTATDKVSLFTGVRRLSDAGVSTIAEFSANSASNTNSFYLVGLSNSAVQFNSRGSGNSTTTSTQRFPAPAPLVISIVGDISGKVSKIRANSGGYAVNVGNQGTGNYGNYPLYIGRRGGAALPFNGHIYGLIGIGKLVSDNEIVNIEKELAKRVGVTLNV